MSSTRRAARVTTTATGRARYLGNALPPELAAGPCVEDWCPQERVPGYHAEDDRPLVRAFRALRLWRAAVHGWAEATGWAREDRPADAACNLARTRRPWSREFLAAAGEGELVDYFEGRREDRPAPPNPGGWRGPMF